LAFAAAHAREWAIKELEDRRIEYEAAVARQEKRRLEKLRQEDKDTSLWYPKPAAQTARPGYKGFAIPFTGQENLPRLGKHIDESAQSFAKGIYDCSEYSNWCAEGLRKAGYNAYVACSDTHAFVLVRLNDGSFVAYEPQDIAGRLFSDLDYRITSIDKWAGDTSPEEWTYISANAEPVGLIPMTVWSASRPYVPGSFNWSKDYTTAAEDYQEQRDAKIIAEWEASDPEELIAGWEATFRAGDIIVVE